MKTQNQYLISFFFVFFFILQISGQHLNENSSSSQWSLFFQDLDDIYSSSQINANLSKELPLKRDLSFQMPGLGISPFIGSATPNVDVNIHNLAHLPLQNALALMDMTHLRFPAGTPANSTNMYTTEIQWAGSAINPTSFTEKYFVDTYSSSVNDLENFSTFIFEEGGHLTLGRYMKLDYKLANPLNDPEPTATQIAQHDALYSTMFNLNFHLKRVCNQNASSGASILSDIGTIWDVKEFNYLRDFIDITYEAEISPQYVLKMFNPLEFVVPLYNPNDYANDTYTLEYLISPYLKTKLSPDITFESALCSSADDYIELQNVLLTSSKNEVRRQMVKYVYEYFLHFDEIEGSNLTNETEFNLRINNVDTDWASFVSYIQNHAFYERLTQVDFHFECGNELYFPSWYKQMPDFLGATCELSELKSSSALYIAMCQTAVQEIKDLLPNAKVGVAGRENAGTCTWIEDLVNAFTFDGSPSEPDALILHFYSPYMATAEFNESQIFTVENVNSIASSHTAQLRALEVNDYDNILSDIPIWYTEVGTGAESDNSLFAENPAPPASWFDFLTKMNIWNTLITRKDQFQNDIQNNSTITDAHLLYNGGSNAPHLESDFILWHSLLGEDRSSIYINPNASTDDQIYDFADQGLHNAIVAKLTEDGLNYASPVIFVDETVEDTDYTDFTISGWNACGVSQDFIYNTPNTWGWLMSESLSQDCRNYRYLVVNGSHQTCVLDNFDDFDANSLVDLFVYDLNNSGGSVDPIVLTAADIMAIQNDQVTGGTISGGNVCFYSGLVSDLNTGLTQTVFNDNQGIIELPPFSVLILKGNADLVSSGSPAAEFFGLSEVDQSIILNGQDIVWTEDRSSSTDIIIESGAKLTIDGANIKFNQNTGITVKAGGELVLENAARLNAKNACEGEFWKGIRAESTPSDFEQLESLQAVVNINDNCLIQNAEVGLFAASDVAPFKGGAIIEANDCTFKNNKIDVIIAPYKRIVNGVEMPHKSSFTNCQFIVDKDLPEIVADADFPMSQFLINGNLPEYRVFAYLVDGIEFDQCSFLNLTDFDSSPYSERGIGLRGIEANLIITGDNDKYDYPGDEEHTTFYGFDLGCKFGAKGNYFQVREMEFQNNYRGLTAIGSPNSELIFSNFEIPLPLPGQFEDLPWGAFFVSSDGYTIEENQFFGTDPNEYAVGLVIDNSFMGGNTIRRNKYHNLFVGTGVRNLNWNEQDLDGLQNVCNQYFNNRNDIFLQGETRWNGDQGVNGGDQDKLANNQFSNAISDCTNHEDFFIDPDYAGFGSSDFFFYFHTPDDILEPDCPNAFAPASAEHILRIEQTPPGGADPFDYNTHCIQTVFFDNGEEELEELTDDLNEKLTLEENALNLYRLTVDGGDEDELMIAINNIYSNSSFVVRDLLIQNYPLSDDVMREVIMRTQPLDPWHLTQVLLSNAPLNQGLTQFLEDSEVLSPFFMSFIYDANENGSNNLREILEMEVRHRQLDAYLAEKKVKQKVYMLSSEMRSTEMENFVDLREDLAQKQWQIANALESDPAFAQSLIDQLDHSKLEDTWEIILSSAGDTPLASSDYSTLYASFEDEDIDYGLAMQHINSKSSELLLPRFPITAWLYRSLGIASSASSQDSEIEKGILNIYPNPANEVAYITYDSAIKDLAELHIYDVNGRLIWNAKTNGSGITEFSAKDWKAGVYLIEMKVEDKSMESIKFIKK